MIYKFFGISKYLHHDDNILEVSIVSCKHNGTSEHFYIYKYIREKVLFLCEKSNSSYSRPGEIIQCKSNIYTDFYYSVFEFYQKCIITNVKVSLGMLPLENPKIITPGLYAFSESFLDITQNRITAKIKTFSS